MKEEPRLARAVDDTTRRNTELIRELEQWQREYLSFLSGFLAFVDGLDAWCEGATPETMQVLDAQKRQALSLLLQHGVRPTTRVGDSLDLSRHEVVETREDGAVSPDTVLSVVRNGYTLLGSPLRRARVIISKHPEGASNAR